MFTSKNLSALLLVLIFIKFDLPLAAQTEHVEPNLPYPKSEYQKDSVRVGTIRSSPDFNKMTVLADELQTKWTKIGGDYYCYMMSDICEALESVNFHNKNQYTLADNLASVALQKENVCPIDPLVALSLSLYVDKLDEPHSQLALNDWKATRRDKAEHWIYTLSRLERETNPDFDFNDLPATNYTPPGFSPGLVPGAIMDKAARNSYEAAIAKNDQKTTEYNKQYHLRNLTKEYAPLIEGKIVEAYSSAPYNNSELKELLDAFKLNEIVKTRIVNAVSKSLIGKE